MGESQVMDRRDFSVDFEGVPLGCARFEAGADRPPLLFVPGTMGHIAESLPFVAQLTAFFSVLTFDHPGLGASAPTPRATPANLSRALAGVCAREFDAQPFAIYGVSLGAVVGALLAQAEPVRALVLDDPVFAPGSYPSVARFAADLARDVPAGHPILATFAAFTGYDPVARRADGRTYGHFWAGISAPTLILAGDAFDARAEALAQVCPGLRGIHRIGGHPVWPRAPYEFAARAAQFAATGA